MTVSFSLDPTTERLRAELRTWGLAFVRPHERVVERTLTYPDNLEEVLAACPVSLSALAIAELGNTAVGHDKEFVAEFGGDGSNVLAVVLAEEMSYSGAWAANLLRSPGGTSYKVIQHVGTPEQIARWVTNQDRRGCFALTEPHFGSDASAVATTAVRDGHEWVINGTKMFITNGAKADFAVVFATIDKALGRDGIRAFVVEKGTPGFDVVRATEDKLGLRHTQTSQLVFDDVRVPLDHCLGGTDAPPRKGGLLGALGPLSTSRPIFSANAVGIGRAALDFATEWILRNDDEFSEHRRRALEQQAVRLLDRLDAASRLILRAAWMRDRGWENRAEAAMAKADGPSAAEIACRWAVQVLGSQGASEANLAEKWYRDVKVYDIFEGSGQIMSITVSRKLLGASASRS
ncbi:MAG: acyl-CoA dehydrogenase family protein [Acidimicrobiia bacterium]